MPEPNRFIETLKYVVDRIIDPLRKDESIEHFTLALPDAQTTTVDSVQGWGKRPPAVLRCPGCEGRMTQRKPLNDIECGDCWRSFDESDFSELELVTMTCPRCEHEMNHGTRHPGVFDIPEYATCPACQYHWDLDHWY